jgi:anti-sigma factor RsiW
MNEFDPLREKSWRRKLTAAEEAELRAWLAAHPEAHADWEADMRLTEAMRQLPDAPVPSNFTSRVLQEIRRDSSEEQSHPSLWRWLLRSWQPRIAVVAAVALAGLLTYQEQLYVAATRKQQTQEQMARAQVAQDVKVVADVRSLPSPDILQNFDTIRKLSTTPGPDPELIALLK